MSKLSAFLNPVTPEPREVMISKRFLDEQGNPVPFKIRPLTQEENDALVKKAKRTHTVKGMAQEYVDSTVLARSTIVAATVEPDFSNAELCQSFGVLDPSMLPGKMLLSGEYARLLQAINELSGFDDPVEEEAKN